MYLSKLEGPQGPKKVPETSRHSNSLKSECSSNRASSGAQRMTGKVTPSKPKPILGTTSKVGRVRKRADKEQNRGFGPLEK